MYLLMLVKNDYLKNGVARIIDILKVCCYMSVAADGQRVGLKRPGEVILAIRQFVVIFLYP